MNNVDVAYESDLEVVIKLLREVASQNPWLDKHKEIYVRVVEFASSGISMQIRTWIQDVGDRAEASSWTNLAIWRSFRDNNIEIPFPQRVVSYKETKPPADLSRASGPIAIVNPPEDNPEILESSQQSDSDSPSDS